MLIMMHGIFTSMGSLKINIFEVRFWEGGRKEGGHKKEYPVYSFDNVDNSGRPLSDGIDELRKQF